MKPSPDTMLGSVLLAWHLLGTMPPATAGPGRQVLVLHCAVFYTPQRSLWQREVVVEHDGTQPRALRVDGLQPYAFTLTGKVLLTALDNEQIRIDLAQGRWDSDFRGRAAGQGRCTAQP